MSQRLALGIDIGGTNTKVGLVAADGSLLEHETVATPASGLPEDVVAAAQGKAQSILSRSRAKVEGAGVGAPGSVDLTRELVLRAPNFPLWDRLPLRTMMSKALGLPVALDNDVNAFGLGEARWGAGSGLKNFVAAAVGTGVGGAIFINGSLYRGASGGAGELGFTVIAPDGPVQAGHAGVLEAFVGRRALDELAMQLFPTGQFPTPRRLTELTGTGDERARQIHTRIAGYLAEAAASWVNILNPEAIIFGGGTLAGADFLLQEFERKLRARALSTHSASLRILPGKLGYFAGVLGAAALWFSSSGSDGRSDSC